MTGVAGFAVGLALFGCGLLGFALVGGLVELRRAIDRHTGAIGALCVAENALRHHVEALAATLSKPLQVEMHEPARGLDKARAVGGTH